MCGINGVWDFKRRMNHDELLRIVHDMNDMIIYRGPDDEGVYLKECFCMGMRRLSIIDLKDGSQPIYNEDRELAVVYNGEIYNHRKLRQELVSKGHIFRTNTDTEVIVHAFEEYGTASFDLFDGMYAFALYDNSNDILYLVRDRLGEKPLYYMLDENHLVFASELKSLMSTNMITKRISKRALNLFLRLTYIPAPLSIYENVYKLRPGHFLMISSDGKCKDVEYWDVSTTQCASGYEECKLKLSELIEKSIENRLISDVPIGAFLSGGVDSAAVVGMMNKLSRTPPKTFTMGFEYNLYDETQRAKEVAEMHDTDHHERTVGFEDFSGSIGEILSKMDEPFADSSVIPTFLVSRFAREYVTVALTGDAGDELFAGYNKYLIGYYGDKYVKIPSLIRNIFMEPLVFYMSGKSDLGRKIKKTIKYAEKKPYHRHVALMHMGVKDEDMSVLMNKSWYDAKCMDVIEEVYYRLDNASDLQRAQYTDLKVVLEGDMLVKVDRMSMLNSLETRIPFLSKDIVEFAMKIPDDYKLNGKNRKRILKDVIKTMVPRHHTKKPKKGFEVPVSEWLRNELKEDLDRTLSKEKIESQGVFNADLVDRLKREHFSGKYNWRDELWVLYVFEKWYEKEFGRIA